MDFAPFSFLVLGRMWNSIVSFLAFSPLLWLSLT